MSAVNTGVKRLHVKRAKKIKERGIAKKKRIKRREQEKEFKKFFPKQNKIPDGPVLKQSQRSRLHGETCQNCKPFFDALDSTVTKKTVERTSRHRKRIGEKERPKTPEGFWDFGWMEDEPSPLPKKSESWEGPIDIEPYVEGEQTLWGDK